MAATSPAKSCPPNRISRKRSAKKADRGALAQAEHLAIYEAILARDPEGA